MDDLNFPEFFDCFSLFHFFSSCFACTGECGQMILLSNDTLLVAAGVAGVAVINATNAQQPHLLTFISTMGALATPPLNLNFSAEPFRLPSCPSSFVCLAFNFPIYSLLSRLIFLVVLIFPCLVHYVNYYFLCSFRFSDWDLGVAQSVTVTEDEQVAVVATDYAVELYRFCEEKVPITPPTGTDAHFFHFFFCKLVQEVIVTCALFCFFSG